MAISASGPAWTTPYTPTPGGSTPSPTINPTEGRKDLWTFFWLSLANSTVIAVAGVVTWWFVH